MEAFERSLEWQGYALGVMVVLMVFVLPIAGSELVFRQKYGIWPFGPRSPTDTKEG